MEAISDKLFEQYGELANLNGISSIPEPARTLIAVYTAQGIIGNGGFAYFFASAFQGNNSYETIINSYKNIGLKEHANAIRSVLDLFPNEAPHSNTKEREEFIYKYMSGDDEENYSDVVDKAESVILDDSSRVYELADKYAEKYV
jgi:ribonucleotide reductase beta subunit family protein with ferritin-like domain